MRDHDLILIDRDESDEDNCKMLVQKENYNKKVSPFQYDYLNDIVIPVDVKISVAIMDILSIQEIELVYIAKFRLLMEWYDYRCNARQDTFSLLSKLPSLDCSTTI